MHCAPFPVTVRGTLLSELIRSALVIDTSISLLLTVSSVSVLLMHIGLVGAYGKHLEELCGSHLLGKLWPGITGSEKGVRGLTHAVACAAPWHAS